MNIQTIELELSKERALAQAVRIGQGDSDGTTIQATVYDGGVAAQLSGMSARFCMRLPDGTHYVRDSDCSVSGSQITYVVDEEHCASVHGKTEDAYFELVDGETVYSTSRFTVIVLKSAEDADTSPAESWDTNFDDWLDGKDAEVAQIETRLIDNVNSAVSDAEDAMQQAISDTEAVIDRAEDAIEAMGDISELAVPLMTPDTRGGAKLEEHGGLALRDGALGIGSLVQQSDGYARGGLAEVTAKGHAEQVATTGKNLLPNNGAASSTSNQVVFTKYGDGSVKANGTANGGDAAYNIFNSSLTLSAGAYCLSGCTSGGSSSTYFLAILVDSTWYTDTGNGVTFTVAAGSHTIRCNVSVRSGVTVSNLVFRPMLELGSTATAYEPYSGGLPSPRPDWEQPIEVVRGRNLLPKLSTNVTNNGVTFTANKDGSITANGTATATSTCPIVASAIIENNETYTLSGCPKNVSGVAIRVSDSITNAYDDTGSGVTFSYANTSYFTCYILVTSGTTVSNLTFYPQLVKGSTPQPYVPYGHVGMEIGKDGVFISSDTKSGYIDSNGDLVSNSSWVCSDYMPVFGRVRIGGASGGTNPKNAWYDKNKRFISSFDAVSSIEVDVPKNAKYLRISVANANLTTCYVRCFMPTTAIPLPSRGWVAGLPDGTADSLRLDGAGKCEWTLPTSMKTFDGSSDESWNYNSTYSAYRIMIIDMSLTGIPSQQAISDRFIGMPMRGNPIQENMFGTYTGPSDASYLFFNNGDSDYSAWNAFLAQNPVTVLYPLATPVTEDCGYVEDWPTDLPEGATLSIRELDSVGIKYFIDSSVTELAKQWYARAQSEYEDRLQALEEAMATIITGS